MKKLLIACTLLLSAHAYSAVSSTATATREIEISQEKDVERHSYYFGYQRVNSISSVNYNVTNTGTTPLNFQSARIGGMFFSAVHNCSGVLAPNERCYFRITYAPAFEGYHVGQFLLSFDQGSDIVVNISGQATR